MIPNHKYYLIFLTIWMSYAYNINCMQSQKVDTFKQKLCISYNSNNYNNC